MQPSRRRARTSLLALWLLIGCGTQRLRELERENAALSAEVERLRAVEAAPVSSGAHWLRVAGALPVGAWQETWRFAEADINGGRAGSLLLVPAR